MRAALVLALLGLAACDRVFGLEHVDSVDAGGDSGGEIDGALPAGLIAWYSFETDAPPTIADASGHGNDAACSNCPTAVDGVRGRAALFDGIGNVARAPGMELQTPAGLTVALWIKLASTRGMITCPLNFTRDDASGSNNTWQLCIDLDGVIYAYLDDGIARQVGTSQLTIDTWTHIAIRWDGVMMRFAVNGFDTATMPAPIALLFQGGELAIGADIDDMIPMYFFDGALDDVRIYNRAISDNELVQLAVQ